MQKNIITLKDSWLSNLFSSEEKVFYKFINSGSVSGSLKPGIHDQLMIMFANNNEELHIQRTRLTIVDILATAGGFASIILLLSRNFSIYYARSIFQTKLISSLC